MPFQRTLHSALRCGCDVGFGGCWDEAAESWESACWSPENVDSTLRGVLMDSVRGMDCCAPTGDAFWLSACISAGRAELRVSSVRRTKLLMGRFCMISALLTLSGALRL